VVALRSLVGLTTPIIGWGFRPRALARHPRGL